MALEYLRDYLYIQNPWQFFSRIFIALLYTSCVHSEKHASVFLRIIKYFYKDLSCNHPYDAKPSNNTINSM